MPLKKKPISQTVATPFFEHLRHFYQTNKGQILFSYKDLTKQILAFNDPANAQAFLRSPQYEALEMYIFLKEYLNNAHLADLLDDWRKQQGKFGGGINTARSGQGSLFLDVDLDSYQSVFETLVKVKQAYVNYIFALTMGVGKTILMATCIFYEFLLARKFPKDPRFCHNALVFAPDTTVLQSLKEIQEFDMAKVLPSQYAMSLEAEVKFHFLEDSGITLNTLDKSDFNIIISNTQKIIRKRQNAIKSPGVMLFAPEYNGPNADLYALAENDKTELSTNQRFQKLTRLTQLGIYVDEAHHAFGKSLKKDMADHESPTSLRLTIDSLAQELKTAGTQVVACFNFTGTPYVDNQLMPEVVYAFSLKDAISRSYLKTAEVDAVANAKSLEFIQDAVTSFVHIHQAKRYEGMLPKMAIFATTIEELTQTLKPELEQVLSKLGLPISSILVNVGDEKVTSADDIREFRKLDTRESTKQFILLVGKGKEGWNCRSLFSVALFREPKSKIFVLQATMRCLRSITDIQQEGKIFLSTNNFEILKKELEANFRISIDEFQSKDSTEGKKKVTVRPRRPLEFIEVVEKQTRYQLDRQQVKYGFSLELDKLDPEDFRVHKLTYSLKKIDGLAFSDTDLSYLRADKIYTELMLVAEIARYLNFSPLQIKDILAQSQEGFVGVLKSVNMANRILYEHVIPKLFNHLFKLKKFEDDGTIVKKLLVKEPPAGEEGYEIRVNEDLFVQEKNPTYSSMAERSFHLDGYGFDSKPEMDFFIRNLPNPNVKKIWFTGMLTHGQTEFMVHYIDPDSHALRSYYPDFLLEMNDGTYYIVEVKGEHMLMSPVVNAKQSYAAKMASDSKMRYVLIPSEQANQPIQEFLNSQWTTTLL